MNYIDQLIEENNQIIEQLSRYEKYPELHSSHEYKKLKEAQETLRYLKTIPDEENIRDKTGFNQYKARGGFRLNGKTGEFQLITTEHDEDYILNILPKMKRSI